MTKPDCKILMHRESALQSIVSDTYTFITFAALIGLGWWIGSDVMQWVGGFFAFVFTASRVTIKNRAATVYTIAEARAAIDAWEEADAPQE